MKKDYKKWMPIKAKINNTRTKSLPVIRAGQIYWVSIGQNIGYEEDGKSDVARIADARPIGRISGQDLARIRERIKYLVG